MKRKVLSMLLCGIMIFSLSAQTVLAETVGDPEPVVEIEEEEAPEAEKPDEDRDYTLEEVEQMIAELPAAEEVREMDDDCSAGSDIRNIGGRS